MVTESSSQKFTRWKSILKFPRANISSKYNSAFIHSFPHVLANLCFPKTRAKLLLSEHELTPFLDTINASRFKATIPTETSFSIMEVFAENGDVENVVKLFEEMEEAKYSRYTFVYNAFIKVYVKGKVYEPNLLRRMILAGCRPDSETYSLIKLIERFQP